jgi:TolB-like protein/Tfp pilus assembly protein PilF
LNQKIHAGPPEKAPRAGENFPGRAVAIRDQLEKTLASAGFVKSARMQKFLRFVVEGALSAKNDCLKETVIGFEVFDRAPDYDSSTEPIVRVEARRLRVKLMEYYESEGRNDPVVIRLPKGGYEPTFELRSTERASASVAPPSPVTRGPRWMPWGAVAAVLFCLVTGQFLWSKYGPARARAPGRLSSHPITSIAVLPLANLSGDPSQDYLADGMTEELITRLAKISSLRVISRTSAMQYKGVRKALPDIAKELNVDAIVEGSFGRSGNQVRITAQLIEGKTDHHLWSEEYQRPVKDMLAVQNQVARMIAGAVQVTLTHPEESQLTRNTVVAPEAYDAYLKGRYFWNKRTEDGFLKSIDYFKEAIAKAPRYAPAYAGLADSYLLLGEFQMRPPKDAFSDAGKAAEKALDLDPDLGEAHASRAAIETNLGSWKEAEADFHRALELSPGYATAHQWYAEGLASDGRIQEALAEIERARELDPLSLTVNVQVGFIFYLARRYDEAVAQFRKAIEMDPAFYLAHGDLAHVFEAKGMYADAISELKKAAELTNGAPKQMLWLARAYALSGQLAQARVIRAQLEKPFSQGKIVTAELAVLDLALGERDRAVSLLEKACAAHNLEPVSRSPLLDPLRSDPRIAGMLGCAAKP